MNHTQTISRMQQAVRAVAPQMTGDDLPTTITDPTLVTVATLFELMRRGQVIVPMTREQAVRLLMRLPTIANQATAERYADYLHDHAQYNLANSELSTAEAMGLLTLVFIAAADSSTPSFDA
jgi:hypothetical protein